MAREAKKHIIDDLIAKAKKTTESKATLDPAKKAPEEQSEDPKRQTPHISPNGIIKRDGRKRFDFGD